MNKTKLVESHHDEKSIKKWYLSLPGSKAKKLTSIYLPSYNIHEKNVT